MTKRNRSKPKSKAEAARLVSMAEKLIGAKQNNLTVEQVADRLGVSKGWLYYHGVNARDIRARHKKAA